MNNEGAEQSKTTAEVTACRRRAIDRITVRISNGGTIKDDRRSISMLWTRD